MTSEIAELLARTPKPGTHWRANFYRVDHDGGKRTRWEWAHIVKRFHEIENFGTLVFE